MPPIGIMHPKKTSQQCNFSRPNQLNPFEISRIFLAIPAETSEAKSANGVGRLTTLTAIIAAKDIFQAVTNADRYRRAPAKVAGNRVTNIV
jgi:hypothetical protein